MELTTEQKEKMHRHIAGFKEWLKDEGQGPLKERKERHLYLKTKLDKDNIDHLSEKEMKEMIKDMWTTGFWTNKEYKANQIIQINGAQKLRAELKKLLYSSETIAKRFDEFKRNIKGMGPSYVSEFLHFVYPDKYCLWTSKPVIVLPHLKMEGLLPRRVFKYPVNGRDYVRCNEVLAAIKIELLNYGFESADFRDVDLFIWYLFDSVLPALPVTPPEAPPEPVVKVREEIVKISSHTEAEGFLIKLGNLLGYETYTADPSAQYDDKRLGEIATLREIPFMHPRLLDTVKKVDVIWFEEEFPKYCFEVEHTTGVTMGLLRLYQMRRYTDVKFLVVAPKEIISKFQREITKDPFYRIQERYIFRSYDDLASMFTAASKYYELKKKFFKEEES